MTNVNFSKSQLEAMSQALGVAPEAVLAECEKQGINPADIAPAPRAVLKDATAFRMRVIKATYGVAEMGKKKGQAQINLQIAPVDGNGKLVKKGTSFLRLALPLDTAGFKFDAQGRERARRDFNTLVSLTEAGKGVREITSTKVGDTFVYTDKDGKELKGTAYETAKVKEAIGYNKLAREILDNQNGKLFDGIEFYTVTNHSEYEGKTNVWFQNLSANAYNDKVVETSAAKMLMIPGGAASTDSSDDDTSF